MLSNFRWPDFNLDSLSYIGAPKLFMSKQLRHFRETQSMSSFPLVNQTFCLGLCFKIVSSYQRRYLSSHRSGRTFNEILVTRSSTTSISMEHIF